MRRNEKRLKQFLEGGDRIQEQMPPAGILKRISSKLRLDCRLPAVREDGLRISAVVASPDDWLRATVRVKDGLGNLADGSGPGGASVPFGGKSGVQASYVKLLETGAIREFPLPGLKQVRVRQEKIALDPACRYFAPKIRDAEVFEFQHPQSHPPAVRDGGGFLIKNPSVYQRTSKMCALPIARASVRIEQLQDSERSGFLREAEALKGIPRDGAELLAVFRCVPIEVISRLRFLEEKKTIVYSILPETNRTRTRVHDMGAIRDAENGEIHLVPHRARFRFASLE